MKMNTLEMVRSILWQSRCRQGSLRAILVGPTVCITLTVIGSAVGRSAVVSLNLNVSSLVRMMVLSQSVKAYSRPTVCPTPKYNQNCCTYDQLVQWTHWRDYFILHHGRVVLSLFSFEKKLVKYIVVQFPFWRTGLYQSDFLSYKCKIKKQLPDIA